MPSAVFKKKLREASRLLGFKLGLNGSKCSLMVGVGCLEIARVASDSG